MGRPEPDTRWPPGLVVDVVVLAGGAARRFGSDKLMAELHGRPVLAHLLDALHPARRVVVVGNPRTLPHDTYPGSDDGVLCWVTESPPGGGPVVAMRAGVAALQGLPPSLVVVLAGDQPRAGAGLGALVSLAAQTGGAVLTDPTGRDQPLFLALQPDLLTAALAAVTTPAARDVLGAADRAAPGLGLAVARLPDRWGASADVDTRTDLADAEHSNAEGRGAPGGGRARGGVEWSP